MANTREDFGTKIIEIRNRKNITIDDLAIRTELQPNTIIRIENGRFNPGLDILLKIGDALGEELKY
jgi:transcriptional regulator with XRE-family HTH domain